MKRNRPAGIQKCPTGIHGLDEITGGGLPRGRPTLVCGGPGCGKTTVGMELLVRGAREFGEPGVFVSFEERSSELEANFASLGFDVAGLVRRGQLRVEHVRVEPSEIDEAGDYDLDGLFIRLGHAIDSVGARRVVLDTLEALFSGFSNTALLRAELRRLFRWLKDRGITAVVTAERGDGQLTRHGLEEYVADCVILLDLRVRDQVATRRMRIVKYRGTTHGGDEYPFLIDSAGISVLPITSLGLDHAVSTQRVSSGIERLDAMLGGKGWYRGSSILLSGTAGSGKSSICARFVEAACRRGERCLYFAFEESPAQIVRNMRSIGCELGAWQDKGLLRFHAARPSVHGLEMHLLVIHRLVAEFRPSIVVIDPISNFSAGAGGPETKAMMTRLIDFLKSRGITCMMSDLTHGGESIEGSSDQISSMIDSWLCLRDLEHQGERNRGLYILKSRGMAHSNQIREFVLSRDGVSLVDVYLGPGGVLAGSARVARDASDKAAALARERELRRKSRQYEHQRSLLEARIAALRLEFASATEELAVSIREEADRAAALAADRRRMGLMRKADMRKGGR